MRPAVFLERDGVLNAWVHRGEDGEDAPRTADEVALRRQAGPLVSHLKRLGYRCLAVTHQPAVAAGRLSHLGLAQVHRRIADDLARFGVRLDGFFYSPRPGEEGDDHGPASLARLMLEASDRLHVDLSGSLLIAATTPWVEAARSAGVTSILVPADVDAMRREFLERPAARPEHLVPSLREAKRVVDDVRRARIEQGF